MSKYLLSALSILGSMNLSALPSQAIGSMPAYGDVVISAPGDGGYVQEEQYEPRIPRTNEFDGDGYVDERATREEQDLENDETYVEDNRVDDGEGEPKKNRNESGTEADSNPGEIIEDNVPDVMADSETEKESVPAAQSASQKNSSESETKDEVQPVKDETINGEDEETTAPVEKDIQPEKSEENSQNEAINNLPETPSTVKPSEVPGIPENVNVDDMKNLMSKKVVKSVVDYIPYVVAFAKAKEAYRYLEKERAFDLPHKAYRDLTLLPQYEEVKMFTTLLCDVFEVDTPSEEKMVANYKAKLPNLVVANKYLNNILDDLYDCKKAQKNGTYELKLKDLNFVNRLLISATSNDSDDSSTLPGEKENNSTVFAVNDEEKKVAKQMFGEKIGSTMSDDENKDTCAKTMLRKIAKNV